MGALSGIRVVDFTHTLAGFYATMMLGDLGAEVIKIERPEGNPLRRDPPFVNGESAYFMLINRNKKSIVVDLRAPEGKRVVLGLVKVSDIVMDNFRPGVLESLGLGYEVLKSVNKGIIWCSVTGFGQDGPYADLNLPSFDLITQAMGGGMKETASLWEVHAEAMGLAGSQSPPIACGMSIGDVGGSIFGVLGILFALVERQKSGLGQRVDIGMVDVQVALLTGSAAAYLATGEVKRRRMPNAPSGMYQTSDGYIIVSASRNPEFWRRLCQVIGLPELASDPRFESNEKRLENKADMDKILQQAFRTRSTSEWVDSLRRAQVPAGPVYSVDQALNDPQVVHRNMVVNVPHPRGGEFRTIGSPIKLSRTPVEQFASPPLHGEHTKQILSEVLGYAPSDISKLENDGVIKCL